MTAYHPDFVRLSNGDLVLPNELDERDDPSIRFYEPAALWEVFRLLSEDSTSELDLQKSTREYWRNGSEHELVLTHMLVDGIGYLLDESTSAPDGIGDESGQYYAGRRAALEQTRIRIRRRGVKPLSNWLDANSLLTLSRTEPDVRDVPTTAGFGAFVGRVGGATYGQSRWEFDRPYKMPPNTVVDFEVSPILPFDHVDTPPNPYGCLAFEEWVAAGGRMRHNQRIVQGQVPFTEIDPLALDLPKWPGSIFPHDVPLGFTASSNTVLNSGVPFGGLRMTGHEFRRQAANQGAGHTWLTGINVLLWQAAYDDILSQDVTNALYAEPFSPLASRVITRAGAVTGGSQRDWWRAGAPLSLVTPTQTPANVYELPVPIRLSPGETLELEIELKGDARTYGSGEVTGTGDSLTNVGVSLTGYSEVRL